MSGLREGPINRDPHPCGHYPARGRYGWGRRGQPTKNLTCLRESPIIVTYVRARVTVGNGADETCQVCARDRSIVTHIPADIIPQGDVVPQGDDMAGNGADA